MADYPDFVITLAHNNTNPKQVTLAFTLGLKGLERGHKTAIVLLLDGVNVGRKDYVNDIDIGEPFLAVKDMLDVYLHQGGQLMVCASCWKHEKFTEDDRLAGTVMITADQVIDILLNAKSTLQLN